MGGQVIGEIAFDSGQSLAALATTVLAAKPDGVIIIANSVDTALLVRHLRMRAADLRIGTSEWAATERLIELGGRAVEGLVVAQYVDRDSSAAAYLALSPCVSRTLRA
jgi:branched-chain amino acid transport system substrate-binding protein